MKQGGYIMGLVLLLQAACTSKPDNVLEINRMKTILWHTVMAEEYFINYLQRDTTLNQDSIKTTLFGGVLNLYQTDSLQFYSSLDYYRAHPAAYKVLIDSVNAIAMRERERQHQKQVPVPQTDTTGEKP